MILRQVRSALTTLKVATVSRLAAETGAGTDEVDAALAFWLHRGDVRICSTSSACGTTCRNCPSGSVPPAHVIDNAYQWIGEPNVAGHKGRSVCLLGELRPTVPADYTGDVCSRLPMMCFLD